jgi:hypothetical protein
VVVLLGSDDAQYPWFVLVRFLCLPFTIWKTLVLMVKLSLAGAWSSCDSVSLCHHSRESNSHLSSSGQSTLCRQALLLQGRCPALWSSDLPPESWGQSPPCQLTLLWQKGTQGSGSQWCLLAEDKGQKGPCPRSSVASVANMLSSDHEVLSVLEVLLIWRVLWGPICPLLHECSRWQGLALTWMDPSLLSGGVPPSPFLVEQDPPRFFGADASFHSLIIPRWSQGDPEVLNVESTLEPLASSTGFKRKPVLMLSETISKSNSYKLIQILWDLLHRWVNLKIWIYIFLSVRAPCVGVFIATVKTRDFNTIGLRFCSYFYMMN